MKFLSNELLARFDEAEKSIFVEHPDRNSFPSPLVNIRYETYSSMNFEELCEFLGSRMVLLMPGLREHFKDEIERMANSERGMKG